MDRKLSSYSFREWIVGLGWLTLLTAGLGLIIGSAHALTALILYFGLGNVLLYTVSFGVLLVLALIHNRPLVS